MGAATAAAAAAVIEDFYLAAHQCTWCGPLPCMDNFASIHYGTIGQVVRENTIRTAECALFSFTRKRLVQAFFMRGSPCTKPGAFLSCTAPAPDLARALQEKVSAQQEQI